MNTPANKPSVKPLCNLMALCFKLSYHQGLENCLFGLTASPLVAGHRFKKMTRDELIEIGKRIISSDGTEEEINELMALFDKNVPRPNGSSLFFWPENYNFRNDDISKYNPTIEEVIDKCLAYKAIQL